MTGVSERYIIKLNNLSNKNIISGMKLVLPISESKNLESFPTNILQKLNFPNEKNQISKTFSHVRSSDILDK
jgi:hypothetical protein